MRGDVLGRDDLRFERVEPCVERVVRLRARRSLPSRRPRRAAPHEFPRRIDEPSLSPYDERSSLPEALRLAYARLSALVGLHELQREAIRLADREVLVAVASPSARSGGSVQTPSG